MVHSHYLGSVLSLVNFQLALLYNNICVVSTILCSCHHQPGCCLYLQQFRVTQGNFCGNAGVVRKPLSPSPVVGGDFGSLCLLYALGHPSCLKKVCRFCVGMGWAVKGQ